MEEYDDIAYYLKRRDYDRVREEIDKLGFEEVEDQEGNKT